MGQRAFDLLDSQAKSPPLQISASATDPAITGLLIGLDFVGRGAAVLDHEGCLIATNARADALLDHLVVVRDGRLHGRTTVTARRLERIVFLALTDDDGDAVAALEGTPCLGIVARAISLSGGVDQFDRARVLLVFVWAGTEGLPGVSLVREIYGLTETEAEVALALARGATASAIARQRVISLETVRLHLKAIYAKIGTRRQAGLVAAIMQLRDVAAAANRQRAPGRSISAA